MRMMFTTNARAEPWSRLWPPVLCAALFFVGTADLFSAIRVDGVNVRLAQVALCAGLVVWWRTKPGDFGADNRRLLVAWAPFFCIFLLAWQFVPTFPRLDQWLSLWMALTAVRAGADRARGTG